eukprot:scaffold565_cov84-Skeletonema_marinoi.AAC.1
MLYRLRVLDLSPCAVWSNILWPRQEQFRRLCLILINFESVPLSLHAWISVNFQPIKPPVGRAFKIILSAPHSFKGWLNRHQIDRDRGRAKIDTALNGLLNDAVAPTKYSDLYYNTLANSLWLGSIQIDRGGARSRQSGNSPHLNGTDSLNGTD